MDIIKQSPAVTAEQLTKHFGQFVAVSAVSFTVEHGEIFGFLGPNGAGKTTTIRMLLGLLMPTAGHATVLGYDIAKESRQLRQHIGYMSQKFSLYNALSVGENLDFFGGVYGISRHERNRRREEVLALVGLTGREEETTGSLATGFKQRLALATAIIHKPELLFLDEPTAGVDPISRRSFWELLYNLAESGTTVIVTTHYMDEAERCQNLALIQHGRIVASGSPQALKEKHMPYTVYTVDCEQPDAVLNALRQMNRFAEVALYGINIHVLSSNPDKDLPEIEHVASGFGKANVQRIDPSLEDVFIANTKLRG